MKSMLRSFYTKPLIVYLVLSLIAISTFAGPAEAMFIPAASHQGEAGAAVASVVRTADLTKIQAALESKVLRQKLMDYGLSPEEAMSRLDKLSDEQVHQLAAHADSLQAGGDAVGFLVALMILALLVVLLIFLLEGRIEVRRK
jgi:cytochrome c553